MSGFNITNYTKEEQDRMLELLQKDKKHADYMKRQNAKKTLMLEKAKAANIVVTDKEIDDYLAKK